MQKLLGKIEGALDALDTDGLMDYVRLEIEELKKRDVDTKSITESIEIRRKIARLENYDSAFCDLADLIDDLKVSLFTNEDIDNIAEALKERLCETSDPKMREDFELAALDTLQECLDPWRREE